MPTWSAPTSLRGAVGPASIVTVTAPPGPNVGVVGGYAVWNDAGKVLLYGPKGPTGWPQTAPDAQGNSLPASTTLTGAPGAAGLPGAAGSQILTTSGPPANDLGGVGDVAIDAQQGFVYGPKTVSGWPATPLVSTVGPAGPKGDTGPVGPAPLLPDDYTANSFVAAPASGSTKPVQVALRNAAGTALWTADSAGNTTQAGALTVAGASSLASTTASSITCTGSLVAQGASSLAGVTSSATIAAKNLTLTNGAGGVLTFADGSTMATAASGTGGGPAGTTTLSPSRSVVFLGAYWNTTYTANATAQLVYGVTNSSNNTTPGGTNDVFRADAPGSIVGYSLNQAGPITGSNTVQFFKNGAAFGPAISAGASASSNTAFGGTFPVATYAFVTGDVITATVNNSANGNHQVSLHATVQWTGTNSYVDANGNLTVAGSAAITATASAKNLTLTSGGGGVLTFADGTSMATAASGTGTGAGSTGSGPGGIDTVFMGTFVANGNFPTAYSGSTDAYFVNTQYSQANVASRSGSAYAVTYPGTIYSIQGYVVSAVAGPISIALFKNGALTSLVATYSNSGQGGPFFQAASTSSPITVAVGDVLQLFVKSTSSATSTPIVGHVSLQSTAGTLAAKSSVFMGFWPSAAGAPSTTPTPLRLTYSSNPTVLDNVVFTPDTAGSVLGFAGWVDGFTSTQYSLVLTKNNANTNITAALNTPSGAGASTVSSNKQAVGVTTFVPGDFLQIKLSAASGATARTVQASMTVAYTG